MASFPVRKSTLTDFDISISIEVFDHPFNASDETSCATGEASFHGY
jgi:hypothetical protein